MALLQAILVMKPDSTSSVLLKILATGKLFRFLLIQKYHVMFYVFESLLNGIIQIVVDQCKMPLRIRKEITICNPLIKYH